MRATVPPFCCCFILRASVFLSYMHSSPQTRWPLFLSFSQDFECLCIFTVSLHISGLAPENTQGQTVTACEYFSSDKSLNLTALFVFFFPAPVVNERVCRFFLFYQRMFKLSESVFLWKWMVSLRGQLAREKWVNLSLSALTYWFIWSGSLISPCFIVSLPHSNSTWNRVDESLRHCHIQQPLN